MEIRALVQTPNIEFGYIELFTINLVPIGGPVFRLTPHCYPDGSPLVYGGITYNPFPITSTDWSVKGDGSASKPKIQVSNVEGFLVEEVSAYGDLVGGEVTRIRTFANYLDGQVDANPSAHFPIDKFTIDQKLSHDNQQMTWQLTNSIDKFNKLYPKRQCTVHLFPGIGSYRL